jgi:hypothetical protein
MPQISLILSPLTRSRGEVENGNLRHFHLEERKSMALRSLINTEVQRALTRGGYLQDIPIAVQYIKAEDYPDYNTDTQEQEPPSRIFQVDLVMGSYLAREIDGLNILPEDRPAYLSGMNVRQSGIGVPKQGDIVLTAEGEKWKCVRVFSDPVTAVYILQLRLP